MVSGINKGFHMLTCIYKVTYNANGNQCFYHSTMMLHMGRIGYILKNHMKFTYAALYFGTTQPLTQ